MSIEEPVTLVETPNGPLPSDPPQGDISQDPEVAALGDMDDDQ
jgi:hypothetical protein